MCAWMSPCLRRSLRCIRDRVIVPSPSNEAGDVGVTCRIKQVGDARTCHGKMNARHREKKTAALSGRRIGGGGGTAEFRLFRGGPDYAFILLPGCGACYPPAADPSTRSAVCRAARL